MCSRQCVEHGLSDLTCLHVKEFVFPSFVHSNSTLRRKQSTNERSVIPIQDTRSFLFSNVAT